MLLRAIAGERADGPLAFAREPDVAIDLTARSLVLTVEQSNTSLVFGEAAILKVFRRLFPGPNPDLEITRALARLGSSDMARPLGWISSRLDGEPVLLAVLSEYLRGACDGWQLAADQRARPVRARPTGPGASAAAGRRRLRRRGAPAGRGHRRGARRPGPGVRHPELTRKSWPRLAGADAAQAREASRRGARAGQPSRTRSRPRTPTLAEITGPVTVQRVHGDYHLGQVMRTQSGWVLLDFEGEPLVPLAQRRDLAPALRDVAGMLRSFDYAARHQLVGHPDAARLSGDRAGVGGDATRPRSARGTPRQRGSDPGDQAILLRALMLDKAVYEVMYEARHRPSWLPIPLDSIAGAVKNNDPLADDQMTGVSTAELDRIVPAPTTTRTPCSARTPRRTAG